MPSVSESSFLLSPILSLLSKYTSPFCPVIACTGEILVTLWVFIAMTSRDIPMSALITSTAFKKLILMLTGVPTTFANSLAISPERKNEPAIPSIMPITIASIYCICIISLILRVVKPCDLSMPSFLRSISISLEMLCPIMTSATTNSTAINVSTIFESTLGASEE